MSAHKQKGMALIIVLLIIAMMVGVVSLTQEYGTHQIKRSSSSQAHQTQLWSLLSAESFLVQQYGAVLASPIQIPNIPWINEVQPLRLDDSSFHFIIKDLKTCFNLNAIASELRGSSAINPANATIGANPNATTASIEQAFLRILINQKVEAKTAEKLIIWIKQQLLQTGYLFTDVSQLGQSGLLANAQLDALSEIVCTTPDTQLRINMNGLTVDHTELLSAILMTPISTDQMQEFLAERPAKGWLNLQSINWRSLSEGARSQFLLRYSKFSTGSNFYQFIISADDHPEWMLKSTINLSLGQVKLVSRTFGP